MDVRPDQAGRWRKSSHSLNENASCVEIAPFSVGIGVRDSKEPGPVVRVSSRKWEAFLQGVASGSLV